MAETPTMNLRVPATRSENVSNVPRYEQGIGWRLELLPPKLEFTVLLIELSQLLNRYVNPNSFRLNRYLFNLAFAAGFGNWTRR